MRTSRWFRGIVVGSLIALTLGVARPDGRVEVSGGTAEQRAMLDWAVGRFEAVGLPLPSLEIRFHADRDGCGESLGRYLDGVVDACWHATDLRGSRSLLHEMAHGWVEANVGDALRDRFLELRGLTAWNDPHVIWDERGTEHAAEIIAWAIGDQADGIYMPSIPNNDRGHLAAAYRLLTGDPLPELAPWMRWAQPD